MIAQEPLMHIPGATEGTTQWRAETLQMVNWGGFHGYHSVEFSLDSMLLTGATGTGKSTFLDAYIALMMPSDVPFNGASNDVSTSKARSADQRNLLTYLKGKIDDNRAGEGGAATEKVLRGDDGRPVWGALALTFVNDRRQRFTVLRVYYARAGAASYADVSQTRATYDGYLDLRELEPLATSRFDKRTLRGAFEGINIHETVRAFEQTLHTRLGIGQNGDGRKALRLLARVQSGMQVNTVDGLYKSMVLEQPGTYAKAERAVEHFEDLEAAYDAMQTEADKEKVLRRLPELQLELDTAREQERLIDTFGVSREGDSPLVLWTLRTEDALLETAEDANHEALAHQQLAAREAIALERVLKDRADILAEEMHANGGQSLQRLRHERERLEDVREDTDKARRVFRAAYGALGTPPADEAEFDKARLVADDFLVAFTGDRAELDAEQTALHERRWPQEHARRELVAERDSLSGRASVVPRALHEARVALAEAAGMDPEELPFVAELVDVAPGEEGWRRAVEVTLSSLARIVLVEDDRFEEFSRAIDSLRLPIRVNFQGVAHRPHRPVTGDPRRVSGKLVTKESPFSWWVQDRVSSPRTDHLCVETAHDFRGSEPQVSRSGQTRNGRRAAHGDLSSSRMIGFSNEGRLGEITADIAALDERLDALAAEHRGVRARIEELERRRDAHLAVLNTRWSTIDLDDVDARIAANVEAHERLLGSNDLLSQLGAERAEVLAQLDDVGSRKHTAQAAVQELTRRAEELADTKDTVTRELDRIDAERQVELDQAASGYLDGQLAEVGDPEDLRSFHDNLRRLRGRLAEQSRAAREEARRAGEAITTLLEQYQSRWPDPNLGVEVGSVDGYRDILDHIVEAGLHARRAEWSRRLAGWSGQDLVPLYAAFDTAVEEIEERLRPVNEILGTLQFGPAGDYLQIKLRRLASEDVARFRRTLRALSSTSTKALTSDEVEERFGQLRSFMSLISRPDGASPAVLARRDHFLDVRKHVEVTAVRYDGENREVGSYSTLGGKSGGESQELVAFIVGAALRYQLGDEERIRPRFAPVFLDEGFVKSDSEFAGRSVQAWKSLGFQLIIGAPLDKVSALEPEMDKLFMIAKTPDHHSHVYELASPTS